MPLVAHGQTNDWINSTDGKWETDTNWSLGVAPTNEQAAVVVTNAASKVVTIDSATPAGNLTISNLTVSAVDNTLVIAEVSTNNPFTVLRALVITNNAALTVSNSAVRVGDVPAGRLVIEGPVMLLSNSLLVSTGTLTNFIGDTGTGSLLVSGATWMPNRCTIGNQAGSVGTLTIASGVVTSTAFITIARNVNTTGTVWLADGQLILPSGVSIGEGGSGQINISNGTWVSYEVDIGLGTGSSGTLTVAGGVARLTNLLVLGFASGATASVWVTGGEMTVTNSSTLLAQSGGSSGMMTISNGTVLLRDVSVGNNAGSRGTLAVAGGSSVLSSNLQMGRFTSSTGMVWVTGGELTVTNANTFVGLSGFGQVTVSNGTLRTRNVTVGNNAGSRGAFTVMDGSASVSSNMTLGNYACTATGTVVVAGGELIVTNAAGNATLEVRTGSVAINGGTLQVDRIVITNACAQFVQSGGTFLYTFAVLDPNADLDGDGMNNGFEQTYLLNPFNAADANGDNDGDSMSNLQEFLAGTDPTNGVSFFGVTDIAQENENIRVTWMTGIGKTNALDATPGGAGGSFSNNFTTLFTVTNTVGTVTNYLDIGAATNVPSRFYRVHLVP